MKRRAFITLFGSTAFLWPLAARAQQTSMPVIGYLSSASKATYPAAFLVAFREGLRDTGYVEGKNLAIEYRWAEDRYDRLPQLAKDLAERKVAAIAATGGLVSTLAAKAVTSTIPIVFSMGDDPVSAGVVDSFGRPGGNITGVSFFVLELGTKLLDLAAELLPDAVSIGLLANPSRPSYKPIRDTIEGAARMKGKQLVVLDARGEQDFETAFAKLAQSQAAALVVTSDPLYLNRRERLVALAARHAIPAVYAWREYVDAGGLMSYGPSLAGAYRDVGVYVGKILKGAKPVELPVQQPTTFDLVLNLKTAKALGLAVPQSLLARADEVIE
jgi:ABC-type uncharacterized transport system substrate-binding protein